MSRKVRQSTFFAGPVFVGDDKAPAIYSSLEQANAPSGTVIQNIVSVTQAQYDAISAKDVNTLYIISS